MQVTGRLILLSYCAVSDIYRAAGDTTLKLYTKRNLSRFGIKP